MNGKKAKQLRKKVYGNDFSPKHREYKRLINGAIVNTGKRDEYQNLKRQ